VAGNFGIWKPLGVDVNGYQGSMDRNGWMEAVMIMRVSQRDVKLDSPWCLNSLLNSIVVASLEGMWAGFVAIRGEVAVVFSLMALMAESISVLEVAGRKTPSTCLGSPLQRKDKAKKCEHHAQVKLQMSHD
jgi:hypothetical protein